MTNMLELKKYENEFKNYMFDKSELGQDVSRSALELLANIYDGILFGPWYDLVNFLADHFYRENPRGYETRTKVSIGENTLHDSTKVPKCIKQLIKPQRLPLKEPIKAGVYINYKKDKYDKKLYDFMFRKIHSLIKELVKGDFIKEGQGYWAVPTFHRSCLIADYYEIKSVVIKESLFDDKEKKRKLINILEQEARRLNPEIDEEGFISPSGRRISAFDKNVAEIDFKNPNTNSWGYGKRLTFSEFLQKNLEEIQKEYGIPRDECKLRLYGIMLT